MSENSKGNPTVPRTTKAFRDQAPLVDGLTQAQKSVHNNFLNSVQTLKTGLLRTMYFLGRVKELKIHKMLGFSSIGDYAEKLAGFSPRQTKELLYLSRKLPEYPQIAAAIGNGDLTWQQAREICSNTKPEDQHKWIDLAKNLPREALRKAQATADPANQIRPKGRASVRAPTRPTPRPPKDIFQTQVVPPESKHFVTLTFTAEQLARWSNLMESLKKKNPISREDLVLKGMACLTMSPKSSSTPATNPDYLVVILHCPECLETTIPTNRGEVKASGALLNSAFCDAIVEDLDSHRRSVIPPRLRRLAFRRSRYTCEARNCKNTQFLEIHHIRPAALGGTDELDNLVVLCWNCHRNLHQADFQARQALKQAP